MENLLNENLTDPNKPAHAIIEVRDDGSALRNDGVELQAANKNPWYVLATVFGEQAEDAWLLRYDRKLTAKNCRAWNGWFCAGLSEVERKDRAKKVGLDIHDLKPLAKAEWNQITKLFQNRMGKTAKLPDPTAKIDFSKTYFPKCLYFLKYIFPDYTDFSSSVFRADVVFGSVAFSGVVVFGSTSFSKDAHFHSASFNRNAYFASASFNGFANFISASFSEGAFFSSVKFKSGTRFDNVKFLSSVPQFHGAELHDNTVFTLPDDYRDNWPPLSGQVRIAGQDEPIDVMGTSDQKRAYNRLRLFMSQALQVDEEQFFHRQEMRCKKETADGSHRVIYALFEAVSDYGSSILRPAEWLFYLWIWGGIAMLKPVAGSSMIPDYQTIPHALGWSLSNLFTVFGFWRLYFEEFKELNAVLQLIGSVQTVSGFALLFLLGLGLRNRFRLR